MKAHSANDLKYIATLLQPDAATVISTGIRCGLDSLGGEVSNQPQLSAAKTTHRLTFRLLDGSALSVAGYVQIDSVLYIVDYMEYPDDPRPNVWLEVYCHAERTAS